MAIAVRTAPIVPNSLSATYSETPALDSTYGHLAFVKRTFTTAPTTPSGWTLVAGNTTSTTVGLWVYAKRGDGTTNSITVDGTATGTTITLMAFSGVYSATFATGVAASGSGTTLASGAISTTENNQVGIVYCALNSTAGGTGFAWSNSYTPLAGGSSSSSQGYAEKAIATSGSDASSTATWTTGGRNGVVAAVTLRVTNPAGSAPTVTSMTPTSGTTAGGTVTTITGTNFTGATGVTFGGTAGTSFSVTNATTIAVTTPAKTAGAVNVVVQHASGNATLTNGFTYVAPTTDNRNWYGATVTNGATIVKNVTAGTGDEAFEDVGGSPVYDSATQSIIIANAGSPVQYVEYQGFSFPSTWSVQGYVSWVAVPSGSEHFLFLWNSANSKILSLMVTSSGIMQARNNVTTLISASSSPVLPGVRYRVSVWGTAGSSSFNVAVYAYGSDTPFWTATALNSGVTTVPNRVRWGRQSGTAYGTDMYLHHLDTSTAAGAIGAYETVGGSTTYARKWHGATVANGTLTTTSAGPGDTPFNNVQAAGNLPTIVNGKIRIPYVTAAPFFMWNGLNLGAWGVRFKFVLNGVVDATTTMFQTWDAGTLRVIGLAINANQQLTLRDGANATIGSTSGTLVDGVEYDLSVWKAAGATTVQARCYTATSTPFWSTSGVSSSANNIVSTQFGRQSATAFGPADYSHITLVDSASEPAPWGNPSSTNFYVWEGGVKTPIYLIGQWTP